MIQFFKRFSANGISGVKGGIKEGFEDFRLGLRDATTVVRPTRSRMMEYDQPLLWAVLILVTLGLVMVYSASIALPDGPKYAKYSSSHFLIRHGISIAIAFTIGVFAFKVPLKVWDRLAPAIFALAFILLIFVLIPGVGKGVNGAKRWIPLGITNFQPSELMKLAVVLFAAWYTVQRQEYLHTLVKGLLPMGAAVIAVGVLLLLQPDMGAFMVISVIAMGILFLGGVNARMFFAISTVVVIAFALMVALSDWRRERIFAYLDPWDAKHALGKGFQLSHSLIAFGRGEIFGVGLGGSVEKLHWLPEAHTDFLLAVIGEEFGLVGVLVLLGLFMWLTRRIIHIGRQSIALDRLFPGLVAQGVGIWIGFQAFINMGVNLGALPTKGLTLPLMSYGGSAILMNMVALAVVLRIDHENRILMQRGGR